MRYLYQYKVKNKKVCFIFYNELWENYQVCFFSPAKWEGEYLSVARVEDAMVLAEKECQNYDSTTHFRVTKETHSRLADYEATIEERDDFFAEYYGESDGWTIGCGRIHPFLLEWINNCALSIKKIYNLDIQPIDDTYDGWVDRTHVIEEHYGL